jgi:hypothetical protein
MPRKIACPGTRNEMCKKPKASAAIAPHNRRHANSTAEIAGDREIAGKRLLFRRLTCGANAVENISTSLFRENVGEPEATTMIRPRGNDSRARTLEDRIAAG